MAILNIKVMKRSQLHDTTFIILSQNDSERLSLLKKIINMFKQKTLFYSFQLKKTCY